MSVIRRHSPAKRSASPTPTRPNATTCDAHTYRTTLIISVQPERAGGLLAAVGGGTPQRFMWFPAPTAASP